MLKFSALILVACAQTICAEPVVTYSQDFTKPLGPEWVDAALPSPSSLNSIIRNFFGYGEGFACAKSWGCSDTYSIDSAHGYALMGTRRKTVADTNKINVAALTKSMSAVAANSIAQSGWIATWRQLNMPFKVGQSAEAEFAVSDDVSAAGGLWMFRQTSNKTVDPATGLSPDQTAAEIDAGECSGAGNGKALCRFNLHYYGALPNWTPLPGSYASRSSKGWVSLSSHRTIPVGFHKYRVDRLTDGRVSFYVDDKLVVTYPKVHEMQGPLALILMQTMGWKIKTTATTEPRALQVRSVKISKLGS